MNPLEARRRLLGRNVYKRTTEGNPAIATDSLARRYPGIEMQGWTKQDSTTGAQLWQNPAETTLNGVTLTHLEDGWINLNGNCTKSGNISLLNNHVDSGTYTLSVEKQGSLPDNTSAIVQVYSPTGGIIAVPNIGTKYSAELNEADDYQFKIRIDVGFNYKNVKVRAMFQKGTTVTAYEPYTGGQPSPSPDYPQEIVSAGKYNEDTQKWEYEAKLTGKNLFDEKSAKEEILPNITIEWLEDEGCFLLNGTCTTSQAFALTDINLKGNIGSNYTVSVHRISGDVSVPNGGACVAFFGVNDSPTSGGKPRENWISSEIVNEVPSTGVLNRKYINTFWFFMTEGVSLVNCKLNVMLEQGNTATDYEPYHTPQTVTLTADRPLTKWDKLEKRNGQWGWVYKSAKIESYTDESVPGEYYSTTGQLSVGAQVWYETTTETFVPLTASEQEAMNNLYTYRPTTVLSNQQDCDMTLTYKTRKGMS